MQLLMDFPEFLTSPECYFRGALDLIQRGTLYIVVHLLLCTVVRFCCLYKLNKSNLSPNVYSLQSSIPHVDNPQPACGPHRPSVQSSPVQIPKLLSLPNPPLVCHSYSSVCSSYKLHNSQPTKQLC